jgi:hypothetical protein
VPPLLTRDATLFGTKQDPCVTAWEAQHAPSSDEKGSYSALVYPDDEQPSWLFFKERNELGEQIVTATVMKCGYDGAL